MASQWAKSSIRSPSQPETAVRPRPARRKAVKTRCFVLSFDCLIHGMQPRPDYTACRVTAQLPILPKMTPRIPKSGPL